MSIIVVCLPGLFLWHYFGKWFVVSSAQYAGVCSFGFALCRVTDKIWFFIPPGKGRKELGPYCVCDLYDFLSRWGQLTYVCLVLVLASICERFVVDSAQLQAIFTVFWY
jgi:hypothetical protein